MGSDLTYLTGYQAMPLERLTMLVARREGPAALLVPELEAPRVEPGPFDLRPWKETADPLALVASLARGARVAALSDQTWSLFLLGLQARMPSTRFVSATPLTKGLRLRKEPGELALLRRAAAAVDRVVERLRVESFSGRTERELARLVGEMTVEEGHDLATFGIVASGPNGASPHHEPGSRRIEMGDGVVVDFGGRLGGYCSDLTRTFVVGPPSSLLSELHEVVLAAHQTATEAARVGVAAGEVDAAARRVIVGAGYGDHFIHRTGHGIGLDGHEHPYLVEGNTELLETGMCFSIEPGIYLPGRLGVRIEDIVTVGDHGLETLNTSDRSLIQVV
jgi:Xaa-Pro aminopeptidase